jgi:ribosome-associated toxin RatA of RatAB toxin-antitoxin module
MTKFSASYEFSQDADLIYGILSDVERMAEFMPLCKRSEVLSRRAAAGAERVEANFLLRYRKIDFESNFDLVFILRPAERRIEVEPIETGHGSGSVRCTVSKAGAGGSRLLIENDYRVRNLLVRLFFAKRVIRLGMDRIVASVRQRAEALERA